MPPALIDAHVQSVCVNPDKARSLRFGGFEHLLAPLFDTSRRIVIQKSAQMGATVLAILRAVWFLDARQAHTMYLFPTQRSALRFSRGRFQVLLEQSRYLRRLFKQVRSAGHLRAGPVSFHCHGARSRADLMSTPVQYLTLDERDELYLGKVGRPQPWSAVELARQRLSGQSAYWELDLSTPTIPGHGVAAEFARSDQHRFLLHCPRCDRFVLPTWPDAIDCGFRLAEEAAEQLPDQAIRAARFRCQLCGQSWTNDERRQAIRRGDWQAEHPERELRGYHLSKLVSPVANAAELVRQWQASRSHVAARQVFYNSVLGLPYLAEGARLEQRFIDEAMARGGYAMAHASQGSVVGVDVGPTWLHVVVAEPVNDLLRIVWAGVVPEWQQLAELLRRYAVQAFVIDAMPETHHARSLVRAFPQGRLCYYRGPGSELAVDAEGNAIRVPRTDSLDAMYLRWRLGKVLAPRDLPSDFAEQLRNLVRVVRIGREGQAVADYLDSGLPDHYAHALNYCELALALRGRTPVFEITPPGAGGAAW